MSNSRKYECPKGGTFGDDFGKFGYCADCLICESCRKGDNKEVKLAGITQTEFSSVHYCTSEPTHKLIILDAYNGGGIIIKQAHICRGCGKVTWESVERMPEFDFITKLKKGEL